MRWNTVVFGIWNLLLIWSVYLLQLDRNLIGGDLLGSGGHLVLISAQEKWEIPINPERVWVLKFSVSCLRTIVSGLHFCLSFRAGFQLQYPLLEGVNGWMGFSLKFFFLPSGWGIGLAFFCGGLFCFIFGKINFSCKDLKRLWRMPPLYPWGLDFCILSWAEVIPHSLVNQ